MNASKRRRIRNFLIYREHQVRYAAQMAAVSAVLTAGLGAMIWRLDAEASRVVDLRAMDPGDGEAQALKAAFARGSWQLTVGLIGFGVVLTAVLAAWQIVTTHKVAGPLYFVAQQMRRVRDGFLGQLRPLRDGDLLHEFFASFREMHESLRERARREAATFARLADRVETAGLASEAAELRALAKEREASLDENRGQPSSAAVSDTR